MINFKSIHDVTEKSLFEIVEIHTILGFVFKPFDDGADSWGVLEKDLGQSKLNILLIKPLEFNPQEIKTLSGLLRNDCLDMNTKEIFSEYEIQYKIKFFSEEYKARFMDMSCTPDGMVK